MASGVYKIVCVATGKEYYGSTVDRCRRKYQHFSLLRKNQHSNQKLQRAFNKYGEQSFSFVWLEDVTAEQLFTREQWYLDNFACELNIAREADAARRHITLSRKMKRRISQALRGHPVSAETREKLRQAAVGHVPTAATRAKLAEASRGRKLSREARRRIGQAATGRNRGESSGRARLTAASVRQARVLRRAGLSFKQLGSRFGVDATTIRHAVLGNTWSDVA